MTDTLATLDQQIADLETSLRLIEQRMTEFVLSTDIPLQLVREAEQKAAQLAELRARRHKLQATPCPYRGLEYFDVAHAANYCGRIAMVAKLVEKVDQRNFIAVVGPSGSGKSSLVRAGLSTALHNGALPESRQWAIRIFRPDQEPLFSLAATLVDLETPGLDAGEHAARARRWAQQLAAGDLQIGDLLGLIKQKSPGWPTLLLLADQFEETFTLCSDLDQRQRFLDLLLAAATLPWVKVLFTLRADFYGRVFERTDFGQQVDAGLVNIINMTTAERQLAIEQPAHAAGRRFEDGLVERIVAAVQAEPGQLPLLEFALTELWAQQTVDGLLTHAAYAAIGEVSGAIARRADDTLAAIKREHGESAERLVRAIFTRLVRVAHPDEGAEDTRRRIALSDLESTVRSLVQPLATARLLVTDRDERSGAETVEVAHEALIGGWAALQRWLNSDRTFLLWRQRLQGLLLGWQASGQNAEALLRGPLLSESVEWLRTQAAELNDEEQTFIAQSQQADTAARQREAARAAELAAQRARADEQTQTSLLFRRFMYALAVVALIALVAAGWAYRLQGEATEQAAIAMTEQAKAEIAEQAAKQNASAAAKAEAEAKRFGALARSRQLAAQSADLLNKNQYEPAILLAIESGTVTDTLEAFSAMRNAIAHPWHSRTVLYGHTGAVIQATWRGDGQQVLTASYDGSARIWDANSGKELVKLAGHTSTVLQATWRGDGQQVLTASYDNTARIWDANSGKELVKLAGHTDTVYQATWRGDGKVLTASADNSARIWDATSGKELVKLEGHTGAVYQATWRGDEQQVLTASLDGSARIWYVRMVDLRPATCQYAARNFTFQEWSRFFEEPYQPTCPDVVLSPDVFDGVKAKVESLVQAGRIATATARVDQLNSWLQTNGQARAYGVLSLAPVLVSQAAVMARSGEITQATMIYAQALDLDPTLVITPEIKAKQLYATTVVEKAAELAKSGEITKATMLYAQALDLDPTLVITPEFAAKRQYAPTVVGQAAELARNGEITQATMLYEQALDLDPTLVITPEIAANQQYAAQLARDGKISQAVAIYQRLRILDPSLEIEPQNEANRVYTEALIQSVGVAELVGEPGGALAKLKKALALDPTLALTTTIQALERSLPPTPAAPTPTATPTPLARSPLPQPTSPLATPSGPTSPLPTPPATATPKP